MSIVLLAVWPSGKAEIPYRADGGACTGLRPSGELVLPSSSIRSARATIYHFVQTSTGSYQLCYVVSAWYCDNSARKIKMLKKLARIFNKRKIGFGAWGDETHQRSSYLAIR
jgi:hypothetical protein